MSKPFVHKCPPEAFDVNLKSCRACGLTQLDLHRLASGGEPDAITVLHSVNKGRPLREVQNLPKSD